MHHLSIPLSMGHEWFADVCIINNAATENKPYEPMCSGERVPAWSGHDISVDLTSLSADGVEKLGHSEAIEPSGFYTRKLRTKENCRRVCGRAPHPGGIMVSYLRISWTRM